MCFSSWKTTGIFSDSRHELSPPFCASPKKHLSPCLFYRFFSIKTKKKINWRERERVCVKTEDWPQSVALIKQTCGYRRPNTLLGNSYFVQFTLCKKCQNPLKPPSPSRQSAHSFHTAFTNELSAFANQLAFFFFTSYRSLILYYSGWHVCFILTSYVYIPEYLFIYNILNFVFMMYVKIMTKSRIDKKKIISLLWRSIHILLRPETQRLNLYYDWMIWSRENLRL